MLPYLLVGEWRECAGEVCGLGGIQLRTVMCEDILLKISIIKSYCNEETKPIDHRRCFKVR